MNRPRAVHEVGNDGIVSVAADDVMAAVGFADELMHHRLDHMKEEALKRVNSHPYKTYHY